MSVLNQVFNDVVTAYLEPRIKRSSIKAVRRYIKAVEIARKIALASYQTSIAAAFLVVGLTLIVVSIIGLLPLDPQTALVCVLVLGTLLTAASGFVAYQGFREQHWLAMSKSHELMEAVLNPWPTAYSVPDPRKIFASQTSDAAAIQASQVTSASIYPATNPATNPATVQSPGA